MLDVLSIITIAPIVDYLIHPDFHGLSNFTSKLFEIMKSFGVQIELINLMGIFLLFIVMRSIFYVFSNYFIIKMRYKVVKDIMIEAFEDFFNARWYFFSSGSHGNLVNTLKGSTGVFLKSECLLDII